MIRNACTYIAKKKNEEDGKRYDIENANSKMKSKENSGKWCTQQQIILFSATWKWMKNPL